MSEIMGGIREFPQDTAYVEKLVATLRDRADDPMWADHAEVSKRLLTLAAEALSVLRVERQAAVDRSFQMLDAKNYWRDRALAAEGSGPNLADATQKPPPQKEQQHEP